MPAKRFPASLDGLLPAASRSPHSNTKANVNSKANVNTKASPNSKTSTNLNPSSQSGVKPGAVAHLHRPSGLGLDSASARGQIVLRIQNDGVDNAAVLAALGAVERHRFVDTALANQAYEDTSLPIGQGQTISKPSVVARMLALLLECPLVRSGRVLEIGTGCAYQAALLAHLAAEVYSLERIVALHAKARLNLHPLRIKNVHLILGDGMLGYAAGAPYAGIVSAAGGDFVPQAWIDQLAMGGRLVAPVVHHEQGGKTQSILVVDKLPTGLHQARYENVHFVPLKSGVLR